SAANGTSTTSSEEKYRGSQKPNLITRNRYKAETKTSTRRINPGVSAKVHPTIPHSTVTVPNCAKNISRKLEMLPDCQLKLERPLKLSANISLLSAVKSLLELKSVLKKGKRGFPNSSALRMYQGDATAILTTAKSMTCRA